MHWRSCLWRPKVLDLQRWSSRCCELPDVGTGNWTQVLLCSNACSSPGSYPFSPYRGISQRSLKLCLLPVLIREVSNTKGSLIFIVLLRHLYNYEVIFKDLESFALYFTGILLIGYLDIIFSGNFKKTEFEAKGHLKNFVSSFQ